MVYKKGDDPNRKKGGRPIRAHNGTSVPERARAFGAEALKFWVDTMRNEKLETKDRMRASENIVNRGYGLAKVSIGVTKTIEHQHEISFDPSALSLEARTQLLQLMRDQPQGEVIDAQVEDTPLIEHKTEDQLGQGDNDKKE